MMLQTLSIPGALQFFSSVRTMRIRVSGSTSATKSLSSSVSVILSWSESNGVLSSAEARVMNSNNYHSEARASARCHTQHGRHQGVCSF